MPSPKKFRETKQKKNDEEKVVLHAKRGFHIRKNATQKPRWKTGKNPGKTWPKTDPIPTPQKLSWFFHMWRGRKFPKSQGAESFTNLKKKHPRIFWDIFKLCTFNVSRILGGFCCPTGWTLWSNGRFRFRIPMLCSRCLGGDFEQPLNFLAFRFVSKSRLFYSPALPERKQLKPQEAPHPKKQISSSNHWCSEFLVLVSTSHPNFWHTISERICGYFDLFWMVHPSTEPESTLTKPDKVESFHAWHHTPGAAYVEWQPPKATSLGTMCIS